MYCGMLLHGRSQNPLRKCHSGAQLNYLFFEYNIGKFGFPVFCLP